MLDFFLLLFLVFVIEYKCGFWYGPDNLYTQTLFPDKVFYQEQERKVPYSQNQYYITKPLAKSIIIPNLDNFVKLCETLIFYENLFFEHETLVTEHQICMHIF